MKFSYYYNFTTKIYIFVYQKFKYEYHLTYKKKVKILI